MWVKLVAALNVFILVHPDLVSSKNVLLLPAMSRSHMLYYCEFGGELVKHGHKVYIALSSSYTPPDFIQNNGVNILYYDAPVGTHYTLTEQFQKDIPTSGFLSTWSKHAIQDCNHMMADENFLEAVKVAGFDHALVDSWPITMCGYILPHHLSIPYSTLSTGYEWTVTRNPELPSFLPNVLLPYSSKMSFLQRLNTLIAEVMFYCFPVFEGRGDTTLISKYALDPYMKSWHDLARQSVLFFLNKDTVLNHPYPALPHTVSTGGLTLRPAKSISSELEEIFLKAKSGVIVVSFGSLMAEVIAEASHKMFAALKSLGAEYQIIWKINKLKFEEIPYNIHIIPWIPQNDLLGHTGTKLFVSHCGNNGQFEAVYHGVPMLCIPSFGDQIGNSYRSTERGYGLVLDIHSFTSSDMLEAMQELLNNYSYSSSIQKASRILKSQPMNARQRTVFWLEHVMTYGGEHLRSHAMDMPFYQYIMLDILALLLVVLLIIVVIIYQLMKCLLRLCCRKSCSKVKSE